MAGGLRRWDDLDMRRLGALGVAAVLAVALAGCPAGGNNAVPTPTTNVPVTTVPATVQKFPDPGTAPLEPAKARVLQAVLAQIVSRYAIAPEAESAAPGVTAAIVTDRWIWSGAAGKDASGTALTPTTSMAVASITKTFIAAEVMRLARDEQIDLRAPISTYVKHKLTANGATVQQHLAMLSGVLDYLPDDYARMNKAITAAPGRHWTPQQALSYDTAPSLQPGNLFGYSNPNYVLLGMMIEKVTGRPLAEVLRHDLAAPAGLQHAAFQDGEKPQPPVARDVDPLCGKADDGYIPCRAVASRSAANAGLAADAPTIARWGYQLYGGRVIQPELVEEMTGGDGEYGLGTMRFSQEFGIGDAVGHTGDMPDYTSMLLVIPAKRLSIAMLIADGNKNVRTMTAELTTALQPLLG